MRKKFAAALLLVGIFAWFRFAVDCFSYTGAKRTHKISGTFLRKGPVHPGSLADTAPGRPFTKRPVHTKVKIFLPSAEFVFIFFISFVFLARRLEYSPPHKVFASFQHLRAPPAIPLA